MSKSKIVVAAEARIAELEAAIAAQVEAEKAAQQAVAPAVARKERLSKRLSKMLLLTEAGGAPYSEAGGIRLRSLDSITLGWHNQERKPAELTKALLAGEVKIEAIGGISYTLRGFLRRSRMTSLPQLRAVRMAEAKRKRAEAALKAAWKAEREAYQAAFADGAKWDEQATAELVAAKLAINTRAPGIDQSIRDAAWSAKNDLETARAHLAWAKATNPDKGVCPCYDCQHDRRVAEQAKAEAERITTLPTGMIFCPKCNRRHRAALERRTTSFTEPNAAELREKFGVAVQPYERVEVPRGFCPKTGSWILLASQWAAEQAKAAKSAKRHPKFRTVTFACPNPECESESTSPVEDGHVICDTCDVEWELDRVRVIRHAKAA